MYGRIRFAIYDVWKEEVIATVSPNLTVDHVSEPSEDSI